MTPDQEYTLGVFLVFVAIWVIGAIIKGQFDKNG